MKKLTTLLFTLILALNLSANSKSICTLSCYANVNFSLDENCEALILVEDVLYDACPEAILSVSIEDDLGNPVTNPVNGSYIGETLMVYITDATTGNACWSEVLIEDKTAPVIESISVSDRVCEDDFVLPLIEVSDNCDPFPVIQLDFTFDCHPCTPQQIDMQIQVTDASGNAPEPVYIIEYIADFCPAVVYPADFLVPCGSDLSPDLLGNVIIEDPELCSEGYLVIYDDEPIPCGIIRHWVVLETCSGRTDTHDQTITFIDTEPPQMIVTSPTNITLDEWNAGFNFTFELMDDCGNAIAILLTEDFTSLSCDPVEFTVTKLWKLVDDCGNLVLVSHDVHITGNKSPKVKVLGQKDCMNPFEVSADVDDMALPLSYSWSSSSSTWTVTPGPDNTAIVTPGGGTTFIEVVVTDASGCIVSDDKKYICNRRKFKGDESVSSRFSWQKSTEFYPNPTFDRSGIVLNADDPGILTIKVYDLSGKIVLIQEESLFQGENFVQIDMSQWKEGIYMVHMFDQKEVIIKRLIKQ